MLDARSAAVRPWTCTRRLVPAAALVSLCGCRGPQSALDPAGRDAERIADLTVWMLAGAGVVWATVIGIAIWAIRVQPRSRGRRLGGALVIGGGAVVPTVVLGGLLAYGLHLLPILREPPAPGGVRVEISAEQWWWRVRYVPPAGPPVELANELHLPVGRRTEIVLTSPDVIHAFWVPSLAGKIDAIPGRVTRIVLEPTRTGVFRGACAEYCGTAHAQMNLVAVSEEPDAFESWLTRQSEPAAPPAAPFAARGRAAFLANGCGACHTVRGTPADGVIGPDLTHVGSRRTLGAAILPNEPDAFRRFIARTDHVKPGAHMPPFGMLPDEELRAIAAWLASLE